MEYPFGDQLKKDIWKYPRGYRKDHYEWKENMGGTLIGSKESKGQTNNIGMSFGGNTEGFFLLPIPFKDLTLTYQAEIGVMTGSGAMGPVFACSDDGKLYYAANFGTVEQWKNGRKAGALPPQDPKCRGVPNSWLIKYRAIEMRIEYKAKDEKKSQIDIWYDLSTEPENPIARHLVPTLTGFTGFYWYQTKFKIRQLKLTGKLDKELAVKVLRGMVGGKEGEEGSSKPGKTARKSSGGGGSETASGSGEGAEAPKATGKKKTSNGKKVGDATRKDPVDY